MLALFQPRRRASLWPNWGRPQRHTQQSVAISRASGQRSPPVADNFWQYIPHPRRHWRARLYPCHGCGAGASCCAGTKQKYIWISSPEHWHRTQRHSTGTCRSIFKNNRPAYCDNRCPATGRRSRVLLRRPKIGPDHTWLDRPPWFIGYLRRCLALASTKPTGILWNTVTMRLNHWPKPLA